jgi:hypothetical protein
MRDRLRKTARHKSLRRAFLFQVGVIALNSDLKGKPERFGVLVHESIHLFIEHVWRPWRPNATNPHGRFWRLECARVAPLLGLKLAGRIDRFPLEATRR